MLVGFGQRSERWVGFNQWLTELGPLRELSARSSIESRYTFKRRGARNDGAVRQLLECRPPAPSLAAAPRAAPERLWPTRGGFQIRDSSARIFEGAVTNSVH